MFTASSVLQDILDISLSIKATTKHVVSQDDSIPEYFPESQLPALTFPSPPDPTADLCAMGLPEHSALKVAGVFRKTSSELQEIHTKKFCNMLLQSSPGLHDALKTCIMKLYSQNIMKLHSDLMQSVRTQREKMRASAKPLQAKFRSTFNHDYVPVLEKYFEYNAYPSVADRTLMARKSMMTDRQIEVWFQNHRNRARKEGKTLARLRASELLPSDVSFDSLGVTMGDLMRPESERLMMEQQEDEENDSDGIESLGLSLNVAPSSRAGSVASEVGTSASTASPQSARDSLNPLTPPFAFPAPYVPQSHTLFGATSRSAAFTFSQPTWARQASIAGPNRTPKLSRKDVDAFADLFARLNVREGMQKQGRRRIAPLPQSRNSSASQQRYARPAATCAITTILCPGRHPAFIPFVAPRATRRARKSPSPPPPPPYQSWMSSPGAGPSKPSTSSTSATAFTFQSPPSYSQSAAPTANAPPEATPTPRRRRKSPQLPRRVPGSSPVTHSYSQSQNQTTSHPTPQKSPRPSHHPYASPSRASSSASSHRVSSSSSSSASSSTPTTPNGSTTSLPMSYPANTPQNTKPTSPIFTAQNIADIFGNAAAFTTPSSQGFSGFGTAGFDSPDFGRMQMGNMFDFSFNASHGPSIVQARS